MIACQECDHTNSDGSRFCESCGAELRDPARAEWEADEIEAEFRLSRVKKARTAFIVIAVVQALSMVIELAQAPALADFILTVNGVIITVFAALAWWVNKQPFAAAIVGTVVFCGMHGTLAVIAPSTIYQGIIIKVIVISMLVSAVMAGLDYRNFQRRRGMG